MDITIIVALIGIISVLVSALVQYRLGRYFEKNKKIVELKASAYTDFLSIVSLIAASAKHGKRRDQEMLVTLTEVKSKIILIGSNEVVISLNEFYSKYSKLDSDEAMSSFSNIVENMRKDVGNEHVLSSNELKYGLFN